MKILLDECVDWRLLRDLSSHEVRTVKQLGWEKIKDGALLALAAIQFETFITVDQNLPYQQNASLYDLAIIILRGRTTRLRDLQTLLPSLHQALAAPRRGAFQLIRG
ncbi:MAG TPA: DUF5615 family PIN-like protein [Thermoanaerobaculia bacterium]|jgi:predicted nuclease of predicted toxin-antitoxin system